MSNALTRPKSGFGSVKFKTALCHASGNMKYLFIVKVLISITLVNMSSAVRKVCIGDVQDYLDPLQLLYLRFTKSNQNKLSSSYLATA